MVVSATSFGYKFGTPHDVDLLFDVRFLANPHFVPGAEGQDRAWTRPSRPTSRRTRRRAPFLERLDRAFSTTCCRASSSEHKSYLSIGIGCTGGKHRSVYVAERLARACSRSGGTPSASRTATPRASEIMGPPR